MYLLAALSLTVDVMQPAISSSCYLKFYAAMDHNLELEAK